VATIAHRRRLDLVVKFSRVAQDVPLHIVSQEREQANNPVGDSARFTNPFEEFGLLMELRRGAYGPPDLRIRTKRPLAIYCPAQRHDLWRMGRSKHQFARERRALLRHVQDGIELDIRRDYILLYGYVEGEDAETVHARGLLSREQLLALTLRVSEELAAKGFEVMDHKPKHFILRVRADGSLLRRHGRLPYVLIDFELMNRTAEHERWLARPQPTERPA
jgi:hypothetical protein